MTWKHVLACVISDRERTPQTETCKQTPARTDTYYGRTKDVLALARGAPRARMNFDF